MAAVSQIGPERLANLQNAFFIPSPPDPKMFRYMGISDTGTSGVQWAAMWGLASNNEIKLQIRRAGTDGDLSDALPRDVLRLNESQLNWMMSEEGREMLARSDDDYDDDQWREIQAYERTVRLLNEGAPSVDGELSRDAGNGSTGGDRPPAADQ